MNLNAQNTFWYIVSVQNNNNIISSNTYYFHWQEAGEQMSACEVKW